jgi:TRAP-type C4-dicarboxylate transport system permease small subunit
MNICIGIALILLVVVVLLQTFTRVVVFYSLPWSEELSRYLFAGIILLGINIAVGKDDLVRVDLIDSFLTEKQNVILTIIRYTLSAIISGVLFFSSFDIVKIGSMRTSPAMGIPMDKVYWLLIIGFLFAFFTAIIKTAESISAIMKKEKQS